MPRNYSELTKKRNQVFNREKNWSNIENTKARKLRSSQRWQEVRKHVIATWMGMCCYCLNAPATEVHHIKKVSKYAEKAFDLDNLAPLCRTCHGWMEVRRARGEDAETQLRERMEQNRSLLDGKQK